MLSDHRHLKRMLYASVLTVASAFAVVGPIGAAEARSAAPKTVTRGTAPASGVTLQTEEAELTKADREFVIAVRLAGLWEIPAGKMAMTRGVSPRVRQIGQMIASQHVRLDALARSAATEVGVDLPDRPTNQQARWLDEMKAAEGAAFDDIFVMRLRVAHGKIFPVIGVVRSSTENDVIRALAQSSNAFVLTHITLLESTGLVRYAELPETKPPAMEAAGTLTRASRAGDVAVPVIWMILATALIAGVVVTARMIGTRSVGGRRAGRPQRGAQDPMRLRSTVQPADPFYPQEGLRLGNGVRTPH